MNILQEIAQRTTERIEQQKKNYPLEKIKAEAESLYAMDNIVNKLSGVYGVTGGKYPFEDALRCGDISFICEVKKASPSKGIIAEDFPYVQIAKDYESAGAAAISVLTEPFWFMGSDEYLREIASAVKIPLLRKDFTVDEYMIYEAKVLGAGAILLICSILDEEILKEYLEIAHSIGLSVLVETHDEKEVEMALKAGSRIIGVNNRNLKTFEVDITLSERLKKLVPVEIIFVSESGLSQPQDIQKLREIGADAALIGESIMRSANKKEAIEKLRGLPCEI